MTQRDIQRRARNAMLRSAITSPQSFSIAMAAIAAWFLGIGFFGAASSLWLVFGVMAELFFVGATMTDQGATNAAVSKMFTRTYNPAEIQNRQARERLASSLEYYSNMQSLATKTTGVRRVQIDATLSEIDQWVEQIYRIARRIDNFEANDLISRDRSRVPREINVIRQRLANEDDESIRRELESSIHLKETQLQNLEALERNVKRADIQLDNTLSALGTVYAQLQLLDSKSADGSRTERLRQQIDNEVLSLRDTIDAIDDVQANSLYAVTDSVYKLHQS